MCHSHTLGGVSDQVTGYQGVFHSHMAHGNTIAYCNSREYDRGTACHSNTLLYCVYDLVQVHVSRHDLIVGAYDAD